MDANRAAARVGAANRVHPRFDPVERFGNDREQRFAFRSQGQPRAGAIEQLAPDQLFKADDMAADRALRHVERLRPGGEAQAQTDRVERPQGVQREPATIDRLRLGDRGFLKL